MDLIEFSSIGGILLISPNRLLVLLDNTCKFRVTFISCGTMIFLFFCLFFFYFSFPSICIAGCALADIFFIQSVFFLPLCERRSLKCKQCLVYRVVRYQHFRACRLESCLTYGEFLKGFFLYIWHHE